LLSIKKLRAIAADGSVERMRQRTITIAGREVSAEDALRFEVVRAVLMGTMSVVQGANKLHMPMLELSRLVNGARTAVIRAFGEEALTTAR
jgi:hypothetical protein